MNRRDITPLFTEDKNIAGKKPNLTMSDCVVFYDEINKEFFTLKSPRVKHIQHIRLAGDNHKNKMERFNGEVKDREKVMRGLKTVDTPILAGYQIYHNYVRPHEGLDNNTPAEVCGIKIEGNNRWFTLIQNAKKEHNNDV